MIDFLTFLTEEKRGTIKSTGQDAARQIGKYITPYLPGGSQHGKGTHTVAKDVAGLSAGDNVTIHGHIEQPKKNGDIEHHVIVSKVGSRTKVTVPASKLHKPGDTVTNEGHKYESDFITRLKQHGVMPQEAQGAGSTAGTDFLVENKKKKTQHKGRVKSADNLFSGETKADTTAAFGQLTISHTPERGWHIGDKARANRPKYAAAIEKAGILEHMNAHHDPDKHTIETTSSGRAKSITMKHDSLEPAEAYLQDHHVDVLQVGRGYGTYSVGEKDPTSHGLPRISGKGKWTIREKQAGNKRARTVMFQPDGTKGLNKSHVNLDSDEHMSSFKKTLGHE